MATGSSPRSRSARISATATAVLPTPVGPKRAIASTAAPSGDRPGDELLVAGERGAGGRVDLNLRVLARLGQAREVDGLVVARAAAQLGGIGARRALDQHLHRAADEALGALVRVALDRLDEALHPLTLDRVRQLPLERRRLGAAPRREDERERRVVLDALDDLERLLELRLGLAGEADDD